MEAKRGAILIAVIILLIVKASFVLAQNQSITGQVITGEAIAQTAALVVNVVSSNTSSLTLYLYEPRNETYMTNNMLMLGFYANGHQKVWFNIDNGQNTTLYNSPYYFNTSTGQHTLKIYANNSAGTKITRNVTFIVNNTFIQFNYSNYHGKGESMDFTKYSFEEMQNLSNITFHIPNKGKLMFYDSINITNFQNYSLGMTINFDSYIKIEDMRVEVDSNYFHNFNESAAIFFYNVNYTNPRILRDGEVCPAAVCKIESFSGGIMKFNVTGFTVYTIEETPSESQTETGSSSSSGSSGGGGGGGGGSSTALSPSAKAKNPEFSTSLDEIKVSLVQGETKTIELIIKNTRNNALNISLEASKLGALVSISESNFSLKAGESKTILLRATADEETRPSLHLGKIIIRGKELEKEMLVALDISSKYRLFDIALEIPKKYLKVSPGKAILSEIRIYTIGETKKIDAKVEYIIENANGETIAHEEEIMSVYTQENFIKSFKLPDDIAEGKYIMYVKASYGESIAISSAFFRVEKASSSVLENNSFITIVGILAILFILIIVIVIVRETRFKSEILRSLHKNRR